MRKFRVTIDIEVNQLEQFTPEVFQRAWGNGSNIKENLKDPDWQENVASNEAMLKAIMEANPEIYKRWVFEHFQAEITDANYQVLYKLAGYQPGEENSALANLVDTLSDAPKAFFTECLDGPNGLCADLVDSTVKVELKSIRLDEVE